MKQMLKRSLSLVALFSVFAFNTVTPVGSVRTRSQSVASYRRLAGWTNHINLYDMGGFYGSFAIIPEYTQSFRSGRMARSLFGNLLTNTTTATTGTCNTNCNTDCKDSCDSSSFNVQGSAVANRKAGAILADYAGLPIDFDSTVSVSPRIQNFLVDFDLFLGLDNWMCGLWFNIQAPVVWAKWKLNLCEKVNAKGTLGYAAGYFAPAAVAVADLNKNFTSYLAGSVPTLNGGVTFQPLDQSMVSGAGIANTDCGGCTNSCSNSKTRLADLRMALGWNFWQDEDYHVGLGLVVAAPTGTRIDDKFLFNPQIGNGHHWEVGGRFTSHYTFWRSCDYDHSFGFYFDVDVTHMFATRQCRVFDLCRHGDMSRYMLAEKLGAPIAAQNLRGGATAGTALAATSQFQNVFTPVANISQANVKVSVPVQVDLTAMFNYTHCGFAWDLGYNFWLTSCERIKQCGGCDDKELFQGNTTYALKGTASVYGFFSATDGNFPAGTPIALSATNSAATICNGTVQNPNNNDANAATYINTGIDLRQLAFAGPTPVPVNNLPAGGVQTGTSIQPIFITSAEVDYAGARNKGMSHTVFTHLSYTWEDHDCWIPFLGIGGKAEFATGGKCGTTTPCTNSSGCNDTISTTCDTDCGSNSCRNSAISEWGIWIKGGVSFN